MREAVIVSTARTPLGEAYRGAFNNTESPTLAGHAIKHAVLLEKDEGNRPQTTFEGLASLKPVRENGGMGAASLFEVA